MEEENIKITFDKLNTFSQYDIFEAKFGTMTNFQLACYDPNKFKPEDKVVLQNEKREEEIKDIPAGSFIRWRYSKVKQDKPATEEDKLAEEMGLKQTNKLTIESNARIVEWSDGSHQIIVGDEYYDIMFSNMDNVMIGLGEDDKIVISNSIKQRILLTRSEHMENKRVDDSKKSNENSTMVKLAYSFYDKQEYNKDDYKFNIKKKGGDDRQSRKKRRRSSS